MNTCNIECRFPICGKSYITTVPHEGFIAWRNGGKIKECLPTLSNEDMEALMTGICGDCWERMYGEDD